MGYSIESRDRINVKGYAISSFTENIGKNVSDKYSATRATEKLLDSFKNQG